VFGPFDSDASQPTGESKSRIAERVGFEPRLSNEINKLGGANGTANLHNSTKTMNSTSYWTLNGRGFLDFEPDALGIAVVRRLVLEEHRGKYGDTLFALADEPSTLY
jgi:hypothetical protein